MAPSIHDILDALERSCGPVLPHSPLWGCFLSSAPAKPQRLPLSAGKLGCCARATRRACRNLCWRAFQTDWAAWQQLEASCLSGGAESELRRCLDDAEDACEMGCSGLSFCSRFNDRPTTLFRWVSEGGRTRKNRVSGLLGFHENFTVFYLVKSRIGN